MNRLFIAFIAISIASCQGSSGSSTNNSLWTFSPKNNQVSFDNACQPLILSYQDVLKGVQAADTAYVYEAAKKLVLLTDSFPTINNSNDTVFNNNLKQGLVNINAEAQGLLFETNWPEIYKATNMISIQLIHLLGEAGYKQHTIYIFNTPTNLQDDNFSWFSFLKTTRDPYHPSNKEGVVAEQILQEH
jgi:hypothetical protein